MMFDSSACCATITGDLLLATPPIADGMRPTGAGELIASCTEYHVTSRLGRSPRSIG